MGVCANFTLLSATFSVENESVVPVNGVINNKKFYRLLKGSQHQLGLIKVPKGVPKPQPQPPRPKEKKKLVVVKTVEEIATSLERCIHDSDAYIPSPPSLPLPKKPREPTPPPPSPIRQTPLPNPITFLSCQSLSEHFSPPSPVLNPPIYESHLGGNGASTSRPLSPKFDETHPIPSPQPTGQPQEQEVYWTWMGEHAAYMQEVILRPIIQHMNLLARQ